MIIIGLTGSIATGKTTISTWLKELGIPVHNADDTVHQLFREDKAIIETIAKIWPDCITHGEVSRECLRKYVIEDPDTIQKLEDLTHPKVNQQQLDFIEKNRALGKDAVVLDVPLLYESGQNSLCNCILVVHCSPQTQRQRAQERGLSLDFLDHLLNMQLPLSEKLLHAEFSLNTDGSLDQTYTKLIETLHEIEKKYKVSLIKDQHA